MLKVKTALKASPIHGIGLFAKQFIPKGTIVWEMSELDLKLTREEFNRLDDITKELFNYYGFTDGGHYILGVDNSRFVNHSDSPNVVNDIAARDIEIGEEITYDYKNFDCESKRNLEGVLAKELYRRD